MDTNEKKITNEQLITFKLRKELLKDFRIALLKNDMTMKDFFTGMVESFIKLDKQTAKTTLEKNKETK